MYYCKECGTIEDEATVIDLLVEEVRYPTDDAHPAEYDEPKCPHCGDYLLYYVCDECFAHGNNEDEKLLVDEKYNMLCSKCFIKNKTGEALIDLQEAIINNLISDFGFDEKNAVIYAREQIEEALKPEAKDERLEQ
jgi:hypothetical protein